MAAGSRADVSPIMNERDGRLGGDPRLDLARARHGWDDAALGQQLRWAVQIEDERACKMDDRDL